MNAELLMSDGHNGVGTSDLVETPGQVRVPLLFNYAKIQTIFQYYHIFLSKKFQSSNVPMFQSIFWKSRRRRANYLFLYELL